MRGDLSPGPTRTERRSGMATILAYASPALGHLLPMSALLIELRRRGHTVHLRTLSTGIGMGRAFGFDTAPIDPCIEQIALDDWREARPAAALRRGVAAFGRRGVHEVGDFAGAVAAARPDLALVDVNCWGALSAAETSGLPWATFMPYTPTLRSPGVPPFGLGLRPLRGPLGRARDAAVTAVVTRSVERVMLPPINSIRAGLGLPSARSVDEFLRRAPLTLVASGKPFQYPHSDWGPAVHLIGPCDLDPPADPADDADLLGSIDRPVVLVTTSSERQADTELVGTALAALASEPVHVVATVPAGRADVATATPNSTVRRFVPHGPLLDRAVCAITHGGMGATQKALARGVPVCVVPHGRDQFEVARRVEVARCGTRLAAKRMSASRLRDKVRQALTMGSGARAVAAGFAATGGVAHGADLVERLLRSGDYGTAGSARVTG